MALIDLLLDRRMVHVRIKILTTVQRNSRLLFDESMDSLLKQTTDRAKLNFIENVEMNNKYHLLY